VRILVVEDDVDSRQMLVAIFEQSGAIVRHAGSVPEALAALDEAVPDVLTCDVGLPGEDGYAFIERVRSRPPALGGRVPALALTAYVGDDARRKAESAGFDTHVGKPVVPGELLGKIAMLVGRSIAVPSQEPAAIRSSTAERRRDWDA
jgi:CheY-like chemotaxis protein